ncbi:hypothetical protein [Nonomuraea sp. NPDC049504]|uniref:hypothetical protein n=1 Tax=Nonomuraea sp. NPDC049504 TaxID=3154729 RepID=UPI003428736B
MVLLPVGQGIAGASAGAPAVPAAVAYTSGEKPVLGCGHRRCGPYWWGRRWWGGHHHHHHHHDFHDEHHFRGHRHHDDRRHEPIRELPEQEEPEVEEPEEPEEPEQPEQPPNQPPNRPPHKHQKPHKPYKPYKPVKERPIKFKPRYDDRGGEWAPWDSWRNGLKSDYGNDWRASDWD